jgi:hypothetical protein
MLIDKLNYFDIIILKAIVSQGSDNIYITTKDVINYLKANSNLLQKKDFSKVYLHKSLTKLKEFNLIKIEIHDSRYISMSADIYKYVKNFIEWYEVLNNAIIKSI